MTRFWPLATVLVVLASSTLLVGRFVVRQQGPVFIEGGGPITLDQVAEKLKRDGLADVRIVQKGKYIAATGVKDGTSREIVVDSQTGRMGDADDDED